MTNNNNDTRNCKTNEISYIYKRMINEDTLSLFRDALSDVNWHLVTRVDDARVAYDNFCTIFNSMFDRYFPKIKIKVNSNDFHTDSNYITRDIKDKIKRRNKLRKLYSKFPLTYGKSFRKLRNEIVRDIRNAKKAYYRQKIKESNSDSSKIWKTINSVLKRKDRNNVIDEIEVDNVNIKEVNLISEAFNEYFSTIGIKLSYDITQPNLTFDNYLNSRNETNFEFSRITKIKILKTIGELKDSSPGIDEIPASAVLLSTAKMNYVTQYYTCATCRYQLVWCLINLNSHVLYQSLKW